MARRAMSSRSPSDVFFLTAALALSSVVPLLGIPVWFRTDDVHWLGWAIDHANPLAAFDPAQNLFGYYRPLPTLLWWILYRVFGFNALGYQLVLAAVAVAAMLPLYRIGRRLGGGGWAGLLAVGFFHAAFLPILYYVYWFSALTFGLELLFLLAALDAFTDGVPWPGRPVRFVIFAVLAGLSKQPALVIIPVVGTGLLWVGTRGPGPRDRTRRLAWTAGLWAVAGLFLAVTPFVIHRPGSLSAMSGAELKAFMGERFSFYVSQLFRNPSGALITAAAFATTGRRRKSRPGVWPWFFLVTGLFLGFSMRAADTAVAAALWALLFLLAAWDVPPSLPWVAGFVVPVVLLLGVDFHVATYLLEPAAILSVAAVLWLAPLIEPAGGHVTRWLDRRLHRATAFLLPVGAALILVLAAYEQVPPLTTMRDVRATFRQGVERLVADAPPHATIGSLSYEELGQTYADIRERPLARRVEQHKTMNPAQLEKFLRLRGRPDLKVLSIVETRRAPPPRLLFATNSEEAEILRKVAGTRLLARSSQGSALTEIFEWNAEAEADSVAPESVR